MLYKDGMDLSKYLESYEYFPRFTDFIFEVVAKDIRQREYLKRADLILIYVWKNLWRKQPWKVCVEADEEKIETVSRQIFKIDHSSQDDVVELLKGLKELFPAEGTLPLKVASAVLSVIFPDKYGVFDYRVREALGIEDEDEKACADAFFRMREIAKKQESLKGQHWTPRMVDKALWALHKFKEC